MSNNSNKKKNKPAAGKSVAGKTNLKNNKQKTKQQQYAEAEKKAKQNLEEKQKAQKQQQKKSAEIHKRREKENEKSQKILQKSEKKKSNKAKRKSIIDKTVKKIKYLTSKEFLLSINYFRVLVFIVLPFVLIVLCLIGISKSVFVNVPSEIRNYEYEGRVESETVAVESAFNNQQKQVFIEALKSSGSRKFDFYINSVISVNDDNATENLCFGNTEGNDFILIATIYDKDGNVIYHSLGLESGKEINSARMFTALPYGLHDVKVAVNAYDKKTNKKVGTKYAKIKIAVGVDENGK